MVYLSVYSLSDSTTGDLLPVSLALYRRLIAYFSGPLQETHCLFYWPDTGDLLPVSLARYRRLLPVFLAP